jgi:hypothetical protein
MKKRARELKIDRWCHKAKFNLRIGRTARKIQVPVDTLEELTFHRGADILTKSVFCRLQPVRPTDKDKGDADVELAGRIANGAPPEVEAFFTELPGFPNEHFQCIQRFGRFPSRNHLLGRETSPAEEAWLSSEDCPGWARSQQVATLVYWSGRGLGDQVRFLLEFTMTPYAEEGVDTAEAFGALKASGELAFGQVPLLRLDGLRLVQTQAIMRHLARKRKVLQRGSN